MPWHAEFDASCARRRAQMPVSGASHFEKPGVQDRGFKPGEAASASFAPITASASMRSLPTADCVV